LILLGVGVICRIKGREYGRRKWGNPLFHRLPAIAGSCWRRSNVLSERTISFGGCQHSAAGNSPARITAGGCLNSTGTISSA
jgi:hypothetical protein